MKKILIGILFLAFPIVSFGQGDNYVLFSTTGDTLITRTSCFCKTKDTLSTYFNILVNNSGSLRLISVFEVREPNKNGIPCADFSLVPKDTLSKYGLTIEGKLGTMPKKFKIKSKVIKADTATTGKDEFVYHRQIQHKFKIGRKVFYTVTVRDIAKNKHDKIEKPRIVKVFGSKDLKKYHFVVIIVNTNIDRQTGKVTTINAHTRIIN